MGSTRSLFRFRDCFVPVTKRASLPSLTKRDNRRRRAACREYRYLQLRRRGGAGERTTRTTNARTFHFVSIQEEAKQEVQRLEGMLSAGKQAALKAINRLETNAREMRLEAAMMQQEEQAHHQAKMATLSAEVTLHG